MKILKYFLFFCLLCIASGSKTTLAKEPPQSGRDVQLSIGKPFCLTPDGELRIPKNVAELKCQIGDQVRSHVPKLQEWLAAPGNSISDLRLSVDGFVLSGAQAHRVPFECDNKLVPCAADDADRYIGETGDFIAFEFVHNNADQDKLITILARYNPLETKNVNLAVYNEKMKTFADHNIVQLAAASESRTIVLFLFYFALIVFAVYGVSNWGLLREPGIVLNTQNRPHSLGAWQMAWWFFIILGGFLYLWMVTGSTATLSDGVLLLAGISAATGLSAVAVNSTKAQSLNTQKADLEEKIEKIDSELSTISEDMADAGETESKKEKLEKEKNDLQKRIDNLPKPPKPQESRGFFKDILTNDGEVSFSRFQMVAWTLTLGFVFCHSVFTTLKMPEFDATLLGLMGLSAGTYVGFKFPSPPSQQ
ncbi:outer membrane murein-binding lipoprotein Lpp [Labrenzia sp. EL_195]|nr:outer membrane murein-binding lipoprotein Lpp [Labrenzia sp. EL_195]